MGADDRGSMQFLLIAVVYACETQDVTV
jgi:hypothetical protein